MELEKKYKVIVNLEDGSQLRSEISGENKEKVGHSLISSQFVSILGNPQLIYQRSKLISIEIWDIE